MIVFQIFKSLPSGAYNAQDRTWNFALSDHDRLMSQVQPLEPRVIIQPLPKWVIRTFSRPFSEEQEADLRELSERLEPTLERGLMPFQKDGVAFALRRQVKILFGTFIRSLIDSFALDNFRDESILPMIWD